MFRVLEWFSHSDHVGTADDRSIKIPSRDVKNKRNGKSYKKENIIV